MRDDTRALVEEGVTVLLRDRANHGPESTFEACKAAAALKMNSATAVLEKILSERDGRQLVQVSAWRSADSREVAPMPEPVRRQGNGWIIRVAE